jgi:hypothetical protein
VSGRAVPSSILYVVTEPQHEGHLQHDVEHGQEWITCKRCGRQWATNGIHAEVVIEGDGYCDEHASE